MIKKLCVMGSLLIGLSACQSFEKPSEPKQQFGCNYTAMTGEVFQLPYLGSKEIDKGFSHIYVDKTLTSAKLSSQYQGLNGKYTGRIFDDSAVNALRACHPMNRSSNLSNQRSSSTWGDCQNSEFTFSYNGERLNKEFYEGVVFKEAILENCAVVYVQSTRE